MNAIRDSCLDRTKVINCYEMFVHMDDLAESLMPTSRLSQNVISAGIGFINSHVDIHPDKIIMTTTITSRIFYGDFSHKQIHKAFTQHGEFKLTLKKFVMFTLFQELAPNDPHDKAGHYYTICINLAKQRFDVLDSVRSRDDESLRSHAEFFMNNLKETWARHYSGSKVQIKDFPIEYVKSKKQGNTYDCGLYTLEYLAKWEGRKAPTLNKEIVAELRNIYLWNWVTTVDFNKREGALAWLESDVKAAIKRYK
ncbi:hypothetical protein VPH35_078280 [Triticum aestivum]